MKKSNSQNEELRRYWHSHVVAWQKSGLSKQKYAQQHGLYRNAISYWCGKFPAGGNPSSSDKERTRVTISMAEQVAKHFATSEEVKFVPVAHSFSPDRSAKCRDKLILRIGRRFRIDVPEEFSQSALVSLIRTLEKIA